MNPVLKPDVKAANKNSFPDTYVNQRSMATMWKHKPDFFVIPIFHCRQPFLRLLYCDASMIVENICCQGSVPGYEFYFRSKSGDFIKMDSESLEITGLEIPRDH